MVVVVDAVAVLVYVYVYLDVYVYVRVCVRVRVCVSCELLSVSHRRRVFLVSSWCRPGVLLVSCSGSLLVVEGSFSCGHGWSLCRDVICVERGRTPARKILWKS